MNRKQIFIWNNKKKEKKNCEKKSKSEKWGGKIHFMAQPNTVCQFFSINHSCFLATSLVFILRLILLYSACMASIVCSLKKPMLPVSSAIGETWRKRMCPFWPTLIAGNLSIKWFSNALSRTSN